MSRYPETAKVRATTQQRFAIEHFINTSGYVVATYENGVLVPVFTPTHVLVKQYFDIDVKKLEEERKEIFSALRKLDDQLEDQ